MKPKNSKKGKLYFFSTLNKIFIDKYHIDNVGSTVWVRIFTWLQRFDYWTYIFLFLSIWTSLYDNFSIKHLNHLTSAWFIGLSISLQFLMLGKVGGYASIFENYQDKVESFMWDPLNISTLGCFALK